MLPIRLSVFLQIITAVIVAWNVQYMGTRHELLLKNIYTMNSNPAYRNQVAIIQSSGTGKSRMVHEMSKLVFTIPLNLRCDEATLGMTSFSLVRPRVTDFTQKAHIRCPTPMFGSCLSKGAVICRER